MNGKLSGIIDLKPFSAKAPKKQIGTLLKITCTQVANQVLQM